MKYMKILSYLLSIERSVTRTPTRADFVCEGVDDGFICDGFGFETHFNRRPHSMTRCCFDCDYFQIDDKEPSEITEADRDDGCAEGECHFRPPALGTESASGRLLGEFPKVFAIDWCGQFKPRNK